MAADVSGFHGVMVNGVVRPGFAYLVFDDVSQPFMALRDFKALGFSLTVPAVLRDGLEVVPLGGKQA